MNHREPLPFWELHSTDKTIVWRDPGDLRSICDLLTIANEITLRKSDRFSYGESPRTPPLKGTSLHRRNNSVERPCGDLEPVYDLFTIMCEITLSESVSHVTYTETNSMHCRMRREPNGVLKRTEPQRIKSSVEENAWKRPQTNKKNEPLQYSKLTEPLKREQARRKKTKYMRTAL